MIKKFLKKIYKCFFKETPTEKFNREEQENYQKWIKNNEPTNIELEEQSKVDFKINPKISIVVPLFNETKEYFDDLLDSLNNQTYSNWELCLADGSKNKTPFIDEVVNNNSNKIKYKFIGKNKGISGNTNEAFGLATGDYIALMDQDDILPKFALYEVVVAINKNKNIDFIYSDEDKIYKENGRFIRTSPHFKQDFALDTLRSYNYICHFSVFSKKLLSKIGMMNPKYDGSQDYDFILRATENASKIIHISKILYNWRISNSSVSSGAEAKPYAYEAAKKAIGASLERNNICGASVEELKIKGLYKIKYPIINRKISIIIFYNSNIKQLKKCIKSVIKSSYKNFEIIIVSETDLSKFCIQIKKKYNIEIINIRSLLKLNYAKAYNLGVSKSNGEYIVFLDNLINIKARNWLEELLSNCQRNEIGCVGGKIVDNKNKIKSAGKVLNLMGIVGNLHNGEKANSSGYFGRIMIQQNVMAISGKVLGISKEMFNLVKGFDEKFDEKYYDIDLCLKLNDLEKEVVYNPSIVGYLKEEKKLNDSRQKNNEDALRKKWKKYFETEDKFFNPNFRKDVPNMRINPQKIEY